MKFLLNGLPGLGKSALAAFLQRELGVSKWNTTKLNGTQVKLDVVEEISRTLTLRSLFDEWRYIWIDEADEIPRVAQVRFLTLIDDLPEGVVVMCTSNCKIKDFEPRFQSRFQVFEMKPPSQEEIATLLRKWIPNNEAAIKHIAHAATMAGGNVRQALLDCEGVLQNSYRMAA